MATTLTTPTAGVLAEVAAERVRQDARFGVVNHPDGTGSPGAIRLADALRYACDAAFADGRGTWRHVLAEEVAEAYAETDPARLRAELLQIAAVCVNWAEALDRRSAAPRRERR
jgi:hypothetical protein